MATRIWTGAVSTAFGTAGNWSPSGEPAAADTLVVPAMASAAEPDIVGVDYTATALAGLVTEPECYAVIGTRVLPLSLDVDNVTLEGAGQSFLEMENAVNGTDSTVIKLLNGTVGSGSGSYGTNLLGISANGTVTMDVDVGSGNSVGVATEGTQTAKLTTCRVASGSLVLGSAVTLTTLTVTGGTVESGSGCTTLTVRGGQHTQSGGTVTTVNLHGGLLVMNTTVKPTTVNLYGGVLDLSADGQVKDWAAATATVINVYGSVTVRVGAALLPKFVMSGGTINFGT